MKKMIKLSLVAAVAVAGLTTTSSAANLEDAIKGVTISGSVSYQSEKALSGKDAGVDKSDYAKEAQHDMDYSALLTVPASDEVTITFGVADSSDDDTDDGDKDSSQAGFQTTEIAMNYKSGDSAVKAGYFAVPGPLVDGPDADGILYSTKAGPLNVAAGYFYTTSATGVNDVMALNLSGKASMLSYDLWYASTADVDDKSLATDGTANATDEGAAAMNIALSADLGAATIGVKYGSFDAEAATVTQTQTLVTANGKAGDISWLVGYGMTGEDGGNIALDQSTDSSVNFGLDEINLGDYADATAMYLEVSAPVATSTSVKVQLLSGGTGGDADVSENRLRVDHKLAKSLGLYAFYSMHEVSGKDAVAAGIDAEKVKFIMGGKYSF